MTAVVDLQVEEGSWSICQLNQHPLPPLLRLNAVAEAVPAAAIWSVVASRLKRDNDTSEILKSGSSSDILRMITLSDGSKCIGTLAVSLIYICRISLILIFRWSRVVCITLCPSDYSLLSFVSHFLRLALLLLHSTTEIIGSRVRSKMKLGEPITPLPDRGARIIGCVGPSMPFGVNWLHPLHHDDCPQGAIASAGFMIGPGQSFSHDWPYMIRNDMV